MPTVIKNKILDFVDDGVKLQTTAANTLSFNNSKLSEY